MTDLGWQLIELRQPWWLLLALQPQMLRLLARLRYRQDSSRYADESLLPWVLRQHDPVSNHWMRLVLLQLCWALIAISMAGPRITDNTVPTSGSARSDIILVIDMSRSMTATDIQPQRFSRVRSEVFHILEKNHTDRVGIVVYAGDAYLLSPPTWDRQVSRFFMESINIGMLPTQGSHVQAAIHTANRQLQNSQTGTIFLFTDGEMHESISITNDLIKTPLYILGVGTEQGASLLSEDGSWLRHNDIAVRSSLHSVTLRQLAKASNGTYITANRALGQLHREYLGSLASRTTLSTQKGKAWHELYMWTLIPALVLLIALTVRTRHSRITDSAMPLFLLFIFTGFLANDPVIAATADKQQQSIAWQAYSKGDFTQSAKLYARLEGYDARMGEGASAYKTGDFARATTQFTRALLAAGDDSQRANALYNLANSYFQKAQYTLAQSTYEDVLRYSPAHQYARINLDFVKSLIKTLENDPFAASLVAKRAGRGPRSVRARDDTQGSGDFSLDDEPLLKEPTAKHERDADSLLSRRIASGHARVQVADDQNLSNTTMQLETVTTRQILEARRQTLKHQREQSVLWKSLLESEAGYPAPVQNPITRPGDLPW